MMLDTRVYEPEKGGTMKATQLLHDLGQSLWLDNITRDLLDGGTLKRYIDELSVTGLTSNPTIFDHAIKNSTGYDAAIRCARSQSAMLVKALSNRVKPMPRLRNLAASQLCPLK